MKVWKEDGIKEKILVGFAAGAFACVTLPLAVGIAAYSGYKVLRRRFDEEYKIIDDVRMGGKSMNRAIREITYAKMFGIKGISDITQTEQFREYRGTLEKAVEYYERNGERHIANEYVKILNEWNRRV